MRLPCALVGLFIQSSLVFFLALLITLGFNGYLEGDPAHKAGETERPGEMTTKSTITGEEEMKNSGPLPALVSSTLIVAA